MPISEPTRVSVRRLVRGLRRPAVERLERIGYAVTRGVSDWVFAPQDRDMQIEMLSGWAAAAQEIGDISVLEMAGWLKRRRELVTAGRSSIRVGHTIFSRGRPPRAEPTGRSRTAPRPQAGAPSSASAGPRRLAQSAAAKSSAGRSRG